MNDRQLLRQYIEHGSETAFNSLVERHKKLVYWTCRREVSDAQLAEDATQAVFIVLARKAQSIRQDASLAGWLFSAARYVSRNIRTSEMRRRRNEERVSLQMQTEADSNAAWGQVEPLLNDALSSLSGDDRSAVLLRYTEGYSFPEIAGLLGTTEEAARKRVNRSLDRMQRFLRKKDVTIAAAVLGALLLERSAGAVPDTCVAISGKAVLASAAVHGYAHTLLLKKGLLFAMEATKKKILISSAAAIVLSLGVTGGVLIIRNAGQGSSFNDPTFGRPESSADAAAHAAIDDQYRKLLDASLKGNILDTAALMAPNWTLTTDGETTAKKRWLRLRQHLNGKPNNDTQLIMTIKSLTINGSEASVTIQTHAINKFGKQIVDETHFDTDQWTLIDGKWMWAKSTILWDKATMDGKPIP